jgi:hypothetical protein
MNKIENLESCVYYHLKDNNKRKKKKIINKLVKNDFFVSNELTNIKKIEQIKDYKKYYYICENTSELLISEIDENVNYLKCSNKNTSLDNSLLLKYEEKELINLKNYLKSSLSSPRIYILNLINIYQKLLKSINLLNNNQIVHNFINLDSVKINSLEPIMTNFSFSIDVSKELIGIKHFLIEYDPTYIEWPLEFHVLSFMTTNKLNSLSNYNIENIINNVIDNQYILKTFGENFVSSYKIDAFDYFKKYVNWNYDDILKDIFNFYKTWDNYALSIMYLRILIDLHRSIQNKNKFIILFMKLLVYNINSNPSKRLSIDLTLNKFESILDILLINDWKDLLNNLLSSSTSSSTSSS